MEISLAVRVRAYRDFPRPRPREFPGAVSTGSGNEPLPLRLPGRTQRALSLHAGADPALPQQTLRAVAGPHRPAPDRRPGKHRTEPGQANRQ